jgi:hypothetical protein
MRSRSSIAKFSDCKMSVVLIRQDEKVIIAADLVATAGLNSHGTISAVIAADMDMDLARGRTTRGGLAQAPTTVATIAAVRVSRGMNGAIPVVRRRIIAPRKIVPPIGRVSKVPRNAPVWTKARRMQGVTLRDRCGTQTPGPLRKAEGPQVQG